MCYNDIGEPADLFGFGLQRSRCPECRQPTCATCTLKLLRVCNRDGHMQLEFECPACRTPLIACDDCDRLQTPGYSPPIKPLLAAAKPFEHVASVRCCDDPGCDCRVVLIHSPCRPDGVHLPCRPGGYYNCAGRTI